MVTVLVPEGESAPAFVALQFAGEAPPGFEIAARFSDENLHAAVQLAERLSRTPAITSLPCSSTSLSSPLAR